jgi:RNA polymerase sigma factor (sigma-70 family)
VSQGSGAVSLAASSVRTDSGRLLTVLYKEHAGDAFRYALHLTGRRADAEDIVQHVFLQAHRHLESGRQLVSPRAWLLTAVKHRAFNLARDQREVPLDDVAFVAEPHSASHEEAAELAFVRGMLWTLPESQHHAFVLRHWSGLSQNEIAEVLETTPSAVESLLGRARSALLRAHDTASDVCGQVRHRLLESTDLGGADVAHLGACRPCRQAHDRLGRAANVAGTLALVPGAHVAHAIADLVPGFSAHAATSTAAAIGTTSGAGAGAGAGASGATAAWGTTTAVTTVGKAAVAAKAMAAVVAATAVVGTLPVANHMVSGLVAGQSAVKSSASRRAASHPAPQAPGGTGAVGNGPPAAVIEAHGPNGHAPTENPGKHGGAGHGLGKPANPGGGKPAGVGGGQGNANGLGAGGNGKAVGKPAGVGGGKPTGVGGGKPTGVGGGKPTGVGGGKPTGADGGNGGGGNGDAGGNGGAGGQGNAGGNGNGGGKPAGAGKP